MRKMEKTLKTICHVCFGITMPAFMILGTVLVLVQLMCCFTGNGHLSVYISKLLRPWATGAAGVVVFAAFFDSYLKLEK